MKSKVISIIKTGLIEYGKALEMQGELLAARQAGLIKDTLLLVEHPPVITLGRRGDPRHILVSEEYLKEQGASVFEVSRGGDVTYHGPGQVVGYPIMDLDGFGKDIRKFVFNIEEVIIRLLQECYGIAAGREDGRYTGVWVGNDKIAAIGIAVKKWVTMHGFAFNVNTHLEHFKWIMPCGLEGRGVTSLAVLTGAECDMDMLYHQVAGYFCKVFDVDAEIEKWVM